MRVWVLVNVSAVVVFVAGELLPLYRRARSTRHAWPTESLVLTGSTSRFYSSVKLLKAINDKKKTKKAFSAKAEATRSHRVLVPFKVYIAPNVQHNHSFLTHRRKSKERPDGPHRLGLTRGHAFEQLSAVECDLLLLCTLLMPLIPVGFTRPFLLLFIVSANRHNTEGALLHGGAPNSSNRLQQVHK